MMELDEIRNRLKLAQEIEPCGLRYLGELTGVSFSTLSRFMRGAEPNLRTLTALENWCNGSEIKPVKPKVVRRFNVGKKKFLVTIEELL